MRDIEHPCCEALREIIKNVQQLRSTIETSDDIGHETRAYLVEQLNEIVNTCLRYLIEPMTR